MNANITSMLQKIRRHKSFHSRNSLQTKGVLAFSEPHLGCTKLRPKKSSVHPYFADSFAFLIDVFCNIEDYGKRCEGRESEPKQSPIFASRGFRNL